MFEKAVRNKVRFDSPKGLLTVEDLWDLPLTSTAGRANLDDIARGLSRQLKDSDDVSFVVKERKANTELQLKFDVVKHVIEVRLGENETATKAKLNAERKQQLLALISQKENEKLSNSSIEELRAMVDSL